MRTTLFLLPALFVVFPSAACGTGGTAGAGGETTTNPCVVSPESCMGTCAGECAPIPLGFSALQMYLWSGPAGTIPPDCPTEAPLDSPGYLDTPPDSVTCSECACGPSQGACGLPSFVTANSAACPGDEPGAQHFPFDPPDLWDGKCTAQDPVASAASVTITPPALASDSGCPASGVEAIDVQGGETISRVCSSFSLVPEGKCPGDQTCTFAKAAGFSVCVANFNDDAPCPPGWPIRHVYYDDAELCSCSCGAPAGESCSTTITVFQDTACQKPLGSALVSADMPEACIDLTPSAALGSKSATPPAYIAGTCAPKLTKLHPWTLCCLP